MAKFISDKLDVKPKTVTRDEKGHYIITKGCIHQDVTITNIYAPTLKTPKYINHLITNIKKLIDNNNNNNNRGL